MKMSVTMSMNMNENMKIQYNTIQYVYLCSIIGTKYYESWKMDNERWIMDNEDDGRLKIENGMRTE